MVVRRQFSLPPEDLAFLSTLSMTWECILEGSTMWVIIHEFEVPAEYSVTAVSVALQLPQNYPEAQIDMAYFFPAVDRADGNPIRQIANQSLDGKSWQRWSRHRTNANPWRHGVDCLETHILLVREWLEREVRGAA